MLYLTLKSFHIFFIVSWFAGLFYLPRIFVNLAMVSAGSQAEYDRLLIMARKLYRFMTPIGVLALIVGSWAWLELPWPMMSLWLHIKITLALFLAVYHYYCGRLLQQFLNGENCHSHVWYRFFNEVPVFVLLAATFLAVFKSLWL